jgi:hypothetical protein
LCCATWSRYWLPSAAQSGNLQLPVHLAFIKAQEVQFHHEVYNQFLWNLF